MPSRTNMIYDSVVARSWKRTLISGRPLWTWPMKQFKIGTYDASVYKYDECIKSSLHFDPFKSLIHCAFSNNTHWVKALQCTQCIVSDNELFYRCSKKNLPSGIFSSLFIVCEPCCHLIKNFDRKSVISQS